jgi:hypothetical protein
MRTTGGGILINVLFGGNAEKKKAHFPSTIFLQNVINVIKVIHNFIKVIRIHVYLYSFI